jgi:hypothetical protein
VRVIARTWSRLRLDWEVGLHRLPFFTQKVAVMLLGALVASLALLGGAVSLVGRLAWLPQESPPTTASTGLARLLSARGLDRARQELEAARRRIDQSQDVRARDRAIKRFSGMQERFEVDGGYRAEAEARQVAAERGMDLPGVAGPGAEAGGDAAAGPGAT